MTPAGLWLLGVLTASLPHDPDTDTWRLPLNSLDEECPWPFDPLFMRGTPIGMYHCPHCGDMVVAAIPHPDFAGIDLEFAREAERYGWDPNETYTIPEDPDDEATG